jgi:predicted DNA-binding protein with PD1-like motif
MRVDAGRSQAGARRRWRRTVVKYTEATLGRVLVVRLEDGDVVHECIEEAARSAGIGRAAVILLGGADKGSRLVVGPEDSREIPVMPIERLLHDVHEAAGVGTIFPDDAGRPVLHLHAAFGRDDKALAGCVRLGVTTWVVGEAVVIELVGSDAHRFRDERLGFEVLEP